jgi:hypothetical protein
MSERNVNRNEYITDGKGIKSCDVYGPTWWQKPRYINLTLCISTLRTFDAYILKAN